LLKATVNMFKKRTLEKEEEKQKPAPSIPKQSRIYSLDTPKQPHQANHSYSGVLFDIKNKSKLSRIRLLSVSVGGELGEMTVWNCDGMWEGKYMDQDYWRCVARGTFPSSTEKSTEIMFSDPVDLDPGTVAGMYVHSTRPDDLGLYYQSFSRTKDLICEDESVAVFAGLGHTSPIPFDTSEGWFRGPRGLAGSVRYLEIPTIWSPECHADFPVEFRAAVRALLICHVCGAKRGRKSMLPLVPTELLFHILEFADYKWFNTKPLTPPPPRPAAPTSARTPPRRNFWTRNHNDDDGEFDSD